MVCGSCAKRSLDHVHFHQTAYPESSVELQSYQVFRGQVLGIINLVSKSKILVS